MTRRQLMDLAATHRRSASWSDAAECYLQAADSGDTEEAYYQDDRFTCLVRAAQCFRRLGDDERSFEVLGRAVEGRGRGAHQRRGDVYALRDYASELALRREPVRAAEYFSQAVDIAQFDPDLEQQTAAIAAAHLLTLRTSGQSLEFAERAWRLAVSHGRSPVGPLVLAGQAALLSSRPRDAHAHFSLALKHLEHQGKSGSVVEEVKDWLRLAELKLEPDGS